MGTSCKETKRKVTEHCAHCGKCLSGIIVAHKGLLYCNMSCVSKNALKYIAQECEEINVNELNGGN